jgi:hypothetical protein
MPKRARESTIYCSLEYIGDMVKEMKNGPELVKAILENNCYYKDDQAWMAGRLGMASGWTEKRQEGRE